MRMARLLCTSAQSPSRTPDDLAQAVLAGQALEAALHKCSSELLPEITKERRRQRLSPLPLWQELGTAALQLIGATALAATEVAITQLSDLLLTTSEAQALHGGTQSLETSRHLATLAETGDARLWPALEGRPAVMWAPQ